MSKTQKNKNIVFAPVEIPQEAFLNVLKADDSKE